jgi:hypothetical protein
LGCACDVLRLRGVFTALDVWYVSCLFHLAMTLGIGSGVLLTGVIFADLGALWMFLVFSFLVYFAMPIQYFAFRNFQSQIFPEVASRVDTIARTLTVATHWWTSKSMSCKSWHQQAQWWQWWQLVKAADSRWQLVYSGTNSGDTGGSDSLFVCLGYKICVTGCFSVKKHPLRHQKIWSRVKG